MVRFICPAICWEVVGIIGITIWVQSRKEMGVSEGYSHSSGRQHHSSAAGADCPATSETSRESKLKRVLQCEFDLAIVRRRVRDRGTTWHVDVNE